MKKYLYLIFSLLLISAVSFGQGLSGTGQKTEINPRLLKGGWSAHWITCPESSPRDYGVYHFRKTFSLSEKPDHFVVHVSADNRYRLYVNGVPVSRGPARGDLYNWYFETVDIAPHLHIGKNTIAAQVWNMGVYAPVAQISNRTAFLLQGDEKSEELVNTDPSWKVTKIQPMHPVLPIWEVYCIAILS